jgi:uncharacterized protein (DUF1684 family)
MKESFDFKKISPYTYLAWAALVVVLSVMFSMYYWGDEQNEAPADYFEQIVDYRQEKDLSFKTDNDSPMENKENFDGLSYFFPDLKYKVKAKVNLIENPEQISIMKSDGGATTYLKFAWAVFELNKREHKVVLLKDLKIGNSSNWFLPFSDQTAGRETYSGGRYLDIKATDKDVVVLDFNLAYNPYCVYNYRYSCPLPPKENFIDTEIKAGEKIYRD